MHSAARISVICAVWHGDPNRLELLRGHAANLARQSVAVEPVYVFDGGDPIPSWVRGRAVSVRENLTIYQAWNVALSLVVTPGVMNLNLDDRLAPDAAEVLEREMLAAGAIAAGGDWKFCYTQTETDDVEPCYPAERVPIVSGWPPVPGTLRRLGCGTHNFGSFGPVILWQVAAHLRAPRYPWRLRDGTLLRIVGDLAWWTILTGDLRQKIVRVPMIIGNYHSHPKDQAEFRSLSYDEKKLLRDPGVSAL